MLCWLMLCLCCHLVFTFSNEWRSRWQETFYLAENQQQCNQYMAGFYTPIPEVSWKVALWAGFVQFCFHTSNKKNKSLVIYNIINIHIEEVPLKFTLSKCNRTVTLGHFPYIILIVVSVLQLCTFLHKGILRQICKKKKKRIWKKMVAWETQCSC